MQSIDLVDLCVTSMKVSTKTHQFIRVRIGPSLSSRLLRGHVIELAKKPKCEKDGSIIYGQPLSGKVGWKWKGRILSSLQKGALPLRSVAQTCNDVGNPQQNF